MQEETSSGRAGISRATAESVRVQLVLNTFDFWSRSKDPADALLGRGAGMWGMFAISFPCVIHLHGALESVNKSMWEAALMLWWEVGSLAGTMLFNLASVQV